MSSDSGKTTFLLGIHNHQPVGNFPQVFEKGYEISYRPFIELMKKFPTIKWSLHLSGILWDFMADKHPEYISDVRKMCDDGRLEIMSGGYYEPILAVIPLEDRIRQIKKLNDFIKNTFGQTPRGIWLTERIWEPSLPKFLGELGIEYTLTDDYHFLAAGMEPDKLGGYYVTEDEGVTLRIFPISQKLRYYIPFEAVEKSIELFRRAARYNSSLAMGDDGEKFGMWPKTFEHVYGVKENSTAGGTADGHHYDRGWLNRFFKALAENGEWLKTDTFSSYLDTHKPSGRVYLPTASYFEMSEWTLPAPAQAELESIIAESDSGHNQRLQQAKKFLRGGFWRNFLTKYQESNNMHKKMLYVSKKLNDAASDDKKIKFSFDEAFNHLMAGQCNCAYWHGVFGGLYLPHLRRAVYEELILAEKNLALQSSDKAASARGGKTQKIAARQEDINKDGLDEILVETPTQNFYVNPARGGCVYEWDIYEPPVNVLNVLTRRYEAYHEKIKMALSLKPADSDGDGVKTIHSIVKMKEKNLERYLNYDWYDRAAFQDHFLNPAATKEDFYRCKFGEQGDFTIEPYEAEVKNKGAVVLRRHGGVWNPSDRNSRNDVVIEKKFSPLSPRGISADYLITNLGGHQTEFLFALENNLAFFAGFTDGEYPDAAGNPLTIEDKATGLVLEARFTIPHEAKYKEKISEARWWCFPVETVSLSEDGFERTLQGGCVVLVLKFSIRPTEKVGFNLTLSWR